MLMRAPAAYAPSASGEVTAATDTTAGSIAMALPATLDPRGPCGGSARPAPLPAASLMAASPSSSSDEPFT